MAKMEALKAAGIPAPSRRDLLRRSGGMLAVGAVLTASSCTPTLAPATSAAAGGDAELIRVCAEFIDCDLRFRAIFDDPDAIEDETRAAVLAAPISDRLGVLLDRMEELRATTSDGIAARAQCLAPHCGDRSFSFDARATHPGRLLDYLMRDAAALAGRGGPVFTVSPDDELLSLCAEHAANDRASRSLAAEADRLSEGSLEAEALHDRAAECSSRYFDLAEVITVTKPRTTEGTLAKLEAGRRNLLKNADDPARKDDYAFNDPHVALAAIVDALAVWGA